jgi:hypothetical protein
MAPDGTYFSRTDALCNDHPSSCLESCWHTSSTTDVYIVLIAPNMESTHTTFPTYTADVFSTTSQPRQSHTSTTSSYPEIAETYVIPWRKLCHQ